MKLTQISGDCGKDDCPAVYVTDRDSAVVQGTLITEALSVAAGDGEAFVEIPLSVLREASGAIGG